MRHYTRMVETLSRPANETFEGGRLRNKLNELIGATPTVTGTLALGGQKPDELNAYVSVLGQLSPADLV